MKIASLIPGHIKKQMYKVASLKRKHKKKRRKKVTPHSKGKSKDKLNQRDLEHLMGVHMQTLHRRNGAWRRK